MYEQAIADYDQALALNPEYAEAYNNRGNAYADLGDYEQAIADYDQALALNPEYAEAYNNRGVAYASLGEYEIAIADYDQAISLNPDYASAYINRGIIYIYQPDYQNCELASSDFMKVLELVPNDPQADAIRSELDKLCPEN